MYLTVAELYISCRGNWLLFSQNENIIVIKKDLTHWGRVTHICVSRLTIIGSDNGLSPGRCQAIIWTNAGILLIPTLGTNFSEILSTIHTFSFKKMHLKMSSAKWPLFRLGLNELIPRYTSYDDYSSNPILCTWDCTRAISDLLQLPWVPTVFLRLAEQNCVFYACTTFNCIYLK